MEGKTMTNASDKRTEDLLRKIRLLRAKAEDPATTEAESLAFAAKVAEMLASHGLEESRLDVEEQSGVEHDSYAHNWTSPARRHLALAVCRLYMVRPIIDTHKGRPWVLIGRRSNIVMVQEMAAYLTGATIRLSNQYKKETGGNHIDFRRGCFQRLCERLEEMRRAAAESEAPRRDVRGNPGNLPALYKNEHALTLEYMKQKFATKKLNMRGIRVGQDGAGAGRRAGDGIGLQPQIRRAGGTMMIGKG